MENLGMNQDSERMVRDPETEETQDPRSSTPEELRREELSGGMEKFEPSHDSKSRIRNPFPTMAQDPGSGMQVKIETENSSRLEKIEKEIVNDE